MPLKTDDPLTLTIKTSEFTAFFRFSLLIKLRIYSFHTEKPEEKSPGSSAYSLKFYCYCINGMTFEMPNKFIMIYYNLLAFYLHIGSFQCVRCSDIFIPYCMHNGLFRFSVPFLNKYFRIIIRLFTQVWYKDGNSLFPFRRYNIQKWNIAKFILTSASFRPPTVYWHFYLSRWNINAILY